ncbi:vacuolar protein sorting-associated protein 37A-like [Halichondria panicea]|uniref:vacuolar protein sorting-associated protein 37A-like n=1 Tax=Halichondria panicea TaxID=6063 RepID=UPI00312B8D2F
MSSWFGSRSSTASNVPAVSSVQKQKHKQIECLREHIPNAVEVSRDELYRVDLTVNSLTITLDIKLPQSFPLTDHAPIVTVYPPMRHPWINEHMMVDGSPAIKNFSIHSNLGKAIQQIVKEFTEHPPELLPMSHPTPVQAGSSMFYVPLFPPPSSAPHTTFMYSSVPHTVTSDEWEHGGTRRPAPPPSVAVPARSRYVPPSLQDKLEDIGQMSTEELNRYLNEEEGPVLVEQYVTKMDVIRKVHSDRDQLLADNEGQAGLNLRVEPDMQESWTQLQEKFLEMQALKTDYEKLLEEQKQLTERYQSKNIVARLKTLTQEAETESEVIAEDFLDNKLSLAEFKQKYKQQRVLHHERKSKHEKLSYSNSSSRRDTHYT